ncbi:MAG: SGNH/GDSL hydrolase family protein [Nitrospinae bacterium]|nr:SGNH/GDSL hydrolase family protein [Nitrospinota bacterium]
MGRKASFAIFLFFFLLLILEGSSYVVGKYLEKVGLFYVPEKVDGYKGYLDKRRPIVGWPSMGSFGKGNYDITGSRIIPAFPSGKSCASLYGDSFTFGDGVSNENAWSNQLAKLLGCRVANYGVPGYGSDQAYLRYLINKKDDSEIVVLGHLSENILRNVNRLRGLLYVGSKYGLKPRFIYEKNSLKLIELPELTKEEFIKLVNRPDKYLDHEYFNLGGDSGVRKLEFPYFLSLLHILKHFHIQSELKAEPWYSEFYKENHPSQGLKITTEILSAFYRNALAKKKKPLVLLIPTSDDLFYFRKNKVWTYQPLIDKLEGNNIAALNAGTRILENIGDDDICSYFQKNACNGHYNECGYKLLAETVFSHLKNNSSSYGKFK